MTKPWNRRQWLAQLAAASAGILLPQRASPAGGDLRIAGEDCEIRLTSVSRNLIRISVLAIRRGEARSIGSDGSLVRTSWGPPVATIRNTSQAQTIPCGNMIVQISLNPLALTITTAEGQIIQQLSIDEATAVVSFATGDSPLLGLGEGGPQFDRRGSFDPMKNGQSGYRLATHGARVPIPWVIGADGWAMYFHHPFGTFDFTGPRSKFQPTNPQFALPLDIFFVASRDPSAIMAEYARLTGHAEMPPLWSFGYQQSHRTLAGRDEVLAEAKTFREKKLPCDALIYLGTGFCPSGWNTENGSFAWNSKVFPDPKEILDELHKDHFRAVFHVVILSGKLSGTARDACELSRFDEEQASCYWDAHRKDFALGIDGWWPDEGDPLDVASRLTRNRMYWEGPQLDRPNERPYALHRNGYAGMQRYGSFLWSGDVSSTWETLKTHIPIAINTALSGIPYWGTDIGGFVPTKEFTAELYVRWFQFGAFCPLFRCHGRAWKLRLPWGWNTGDPGPSEISNYSGAAIPDSSQLHNEKVEPICRKYLELRYRLLPYLYSTAHECATTGMPIMRALWLHYPNDSRAVSCGDQYLWGKNMLVAPVVEKGATTRALYLPVGNWYDFWTSDRMEGGREISRKVDLDTMPLYVRAGSILPLGPIKQFTAETVDQPLSILLYPGSDASFLLYEDDGTSFNYRKGAWMGLRMDWHDASRTLNLSLAGGSRMLTPPHRKLEVKLGQQTKSVKFSGNPITVSF